ncbi:MAG: hypothetical protein D6761_11640 [Candidatus Dadabacteria bacterium]|nr:MAG: hypothetical protein D6761_11640 [Candidatus Dadabacteria bacterium]
MLVSSFVLVFVLAIPEALVVLVARALCRRGDGQEQSFLNAYVSVISNFGVFLGNQVVGIACVVYIYLEYLKSTQS